MNEVEKGSIVVKRKPEWLRIKKSGIYDSNIATERLLRSHNLNTVCESAQCPNKSECFGNKTATFIILGDICTRRCSFCAVDKDTRLLKEPDPMEPENIARAAKELLLDYIVITMVTRDDLEDGGAGHLISVMKKIRELYDPEADIEVLISDLQNKTEYLDKILVAQPAVFNHNVETVARLYPEVRPQADYERSLNILSHAKKSAPRIPTKSGFMIGLGETETEIMDLMKDLRLVDVDILTIGQYLAPSSLHYPVYKYINPEKFENYRQSALEKGFKTCFSGPFVRSSYKAKDALSFKTTNHN